MKARNINLAQRKWDSFATAVLPPNCGETQRREMRRAFYGGMQALLQFTKSDELCDLSDDDGAAVLQGIEDELSAFAHAVGEGRA